MKNLTKSLFITVLALVLGSSYAVAQIAQDLQFFRPPDKRGLNVFEAPKTTDVEFEGLYVRTGGDFAIQFHALTQSNDFAADPLVDLSNNFALPTANLNFDVQIENGLRMHLRTYLSSKHHSEAWVKGGYFQIDRLDFIEEGFAEEFMQNARFRFGMDEINYGDTHFRRSDNARAIFNPFVGNYIMDSFSTEPFAEFSYFANDIFGVVGVSNGRLNQRPLPGDDGIAMFAKLGYDSQVNEDLRVRLTGSVYNSTDKGTRDYLYNGDRAGARYYQLLTGEVSGDSDFLPRFNPRFAYQTAIQFNPFIKFQGLEVFGVVEFVNNGDDDIGGGFNQYGAEVLYRFGADEDLYVGGRYNMVTGEQTDASESIDITRLNLGAGWFMTQNVLAKIEYVTSTYDGNGWNGTKFEGAEFSGVVLEAVISF
ncbi:hypothetical protein AB2B38_012810 [Balneola sp. MJW-20]|uniref:hypothetical protein n=1 Tax=Gracilimonas aurantiaca TaxID=3234185 RepID=UPI0034665D91